MFEMPRTGNKDDLMHQTDEHKFDKKLFAGFQYYIVYLTARLFT